MLKLHVALATRLMGHCAVCFYNFVLTLQSDVDIYYQQLCSQFQRKNCIYLRGRASALHAEGLRFNPWYMQVGHIPAHTCTDKKFLFGPWRDTATDNTELDGPMA